jgi:hypothetical protein
VLLSSATYGNEKSLDPRKDLLMNNGQRYWVTIQPSKGFTGFIDLKLTPYVEDPDSKNLIFGDDKQVLINVSLHG